jgi:hypothetical protein
MTIKKSVPFKANDPVAAAAQKRHREIMAAKNELVKSWTALARKCQEFREAQQYKYIVNPATKKPFTSFSSWVKFAFGKSKSTLFAATRILRELDGMVSDSDLDEMTKENAEALVQVKESGEPVTPELVEAAKKEPARVMRERIASVSPIDEKQPKVKASVLGPFHVTEKTATDFQRAMAIAAEKTATDEGEEEDRALGFIARHFLAGIDTTREQEVAA